MNFIKPLKIAIKCLEHSKIPYEEWNFGGGSALTFYYNHRISIDVDIFLSNPQYITLLSPRLNDFVADYSKDYVEQSNFLKISMGKQEIDFIVAPNLTGLQPLETFIESLKVRIDHPQEIIAKKFFYRPESIKARDIVDLVVVYMDKKDELRNAIEKLLLSKIEIILNRLSFMKLHKDEFCISIKELKIKETLKELEFLKIAESFFNSIITR
ncbi:MAG: nucleotidyl transferase AbiEii/AbiGii toxin family protein [Brevinematia bacterium]